MLQHLLYIVWSPNETLFHIGSFAVRWYGLCWLIGLLVGYLLMHRLYREQHIPEEKFEPLFLYIFFSVLIGARLGHCLFYEPDYFLGSWDHFVEMFLPIRHMADGSWKYIGYQGLASHGGVIGMLIALWLYVRKTGVGLWTVLDNMGICSCITAMFIRLGNLMNSEIIGKVTDVPWAFIFAKVDPYPRHPGQLYEALAYLCIFILILAIYKRRGPQSVGTGFYFGLCLTAVFTARFLIEFTKDIQVAFEAGMALDMGQLLSIPFIIIGVASMVGGKWMEKLGAKSLKKKK
ncbi:MAG: prolipoprotein diacylglyceryl transferase [Prevotella sp.]|jgi:phosphatidylglycerol:prolipoprotein diacylglycerol transferase